MPAQSHAPLAPAIAPPAVEGGGQGPGQRGSVGNSGLIERLFGPGARPAPGEGRLAGFMGTFADLGRVDPSSAPAAALARMAVAPAPEGADEEKVTPKVGTAAAGVYDKHKPKVAGLTTKMTPAQVSDLTAFKANWEANKARYEAVAAKAGVPAPLVAAIHWRESTGNFKTYLHQGDPLGKKATHVPKDIPIFTEWEEAAVHALTMSDKKQVRDDLGMTKDTKDGASMATYAEFYNGLGYHNKKRASPYVYSGTDQYDKGKYVADGKYSKNTKDQQLGVMQMVGSVGGMDEKIKAQPAAGPTGWDSLLAGRTIQRGSKGPLVKELQAKLGAAGFPCGKDGKFGPTVEKAVRAYQKANKLDEDGVVGKDMAAKLVAPAAPAAPVDPAPAAPAAPAATPEAPPAP